jgi:hypothetical protein
MHARMPALRLLRIARTIDLEAAVGLEIAHVDSDAFYASVEQRDDAGLWDKPAIAGGSGAIWRRPKSAKSRVCAGARGERTRHSRV